VAAALKKEHGLDVELIDGQRGEFTVSVDGKVVPEKDESLPSIEEVVKAVKQAAPAEAATR
jgi:hypothetical protein